MLVVLRLAAQLAIVARAPDSVYACDAVDVSVAVSARGSVTPRIAVPSFAPFEVLRSSMLPHLSYATRTGVDASVLVEHRFTITTDHVGRFTIPSFEAQLDGERVVSRPLTVVVRPPRARAIPLVLTRARIDTSAEVSLRALARAETVYVGQQATYEVAVFLNQAVRERLRRNPTFYPPEMQAMLAYDLPPLSSSGSRQKRGARPLAEAGSQCFDALVYRRALFPIVSGKLVIPPAQLVYNTGISSTSLFSREESHELQTDSVTIVSLEPPAEGRPAEYTGAVGQLELATDMDSTSTRVGDPILLTVRVSGAGNVKLFPRPLVRVPWAALVAADERVTIDTSSPRIGGVKEFDWVLTPRIAGEFDVPPIRYGYYDPRQRRYDVAVASGKHVRVSSAALASDTTSVETPLTIRPRFGGASWPPPQSSPVFWLLLALAPVPALVVRSKRPRTARPTRIDRNPMRALLAGPSGTDPITVRREFVRALAHRLGCSPEDFTHPGALYRALCRAGVSESTAQRAESVLRELDLAAYAAKTETPRQAITSVAAVARAVDTEALARSELPFWVPMILVAFALTVAAAATAADPSAIRFARGVSAYMRQDYRAAQTEFADVAALSPRAPDAWANYGTASWALADTAAAVLGWRQALALEPSASDLQSRMVMVRDEAPTAPGWVPPIPRDAAVWLFAILWLGAWALAWIGRNPGSWAARLPLPVAACAVIVGLASIELETRISGTRLAIVRATASLVSEPALGMDRGPTLGVGEIVRIEGRRGGWTRVVAADDRDGWIASSRLFFVADRRPATALPRD